MHELLLAGLLESGLYGIGGILLAVIAFVVIDLLTPGHLAKQIAKEHNMALAIVVGSVFLGICIIIASAISG